MARRQDRRRVVKLRKMGRTYGEIRRLLDIPKSTLSNWLSKYPLNDDELKRIKKSIKRNKDIAVERCRLTKQKKRETRLKKYCDEEKKRLIPLSDKELYLTGLFLYWGEGSKSMKSSLSLNNTDPKVVGFYLFWLTEALRVTKNKIKIYLHLYSDMNVDKEQAFWSKKLGISKKQFAKPYIKKSLRIDIDHKGYGHGTCGLLVNDVRLKERVMMGIEALADYYGAKTGF